MTTRTVAQDETGRLSAGSSARRFALVAWCTWFYLMVLLLGVAALPSHGHPHYGSDTAHFVDLAIRIDEEAVIYDLAMSMNWVTDVVDMTPQNLYSITEDERQALREALDACFKEANPVLIDGVRVRPVVKNFELKRPIDPTAPDRVLPADVHMDLVYPVKGAVSRVSMTWEQLPYDYNLQRMGLDARQPLSAPLRAFGDRLIVTFTPKEPQVTWHAPTAPIEARPLPRPQKAKLATVGVPMLSATLLSVVVLGVGGVRLSRAWSAFRKSALLMGAIGLIGAVAAYDVWGVPVRVPWETSAQPPSPEEANRIFETLHRNVYRAFDYESESAIYDALAETVDGLLLEQIYHEVYQSMILRDQGGAVAQVQSVDILDSEVMERGVMPETGDVGFTIESHYRVHGAVSHWGHTHFRTNEYRARYTIAHRDDAWKITGVDVLSHERVEPDAAGSQQAS